MGKTRMEELCYELYGSWNQHDSWHRYAMIRELRALMKQPIRGSSGSDHFEDECDDDQTFDDKEEIHQVHETLTNPAPIEEDVSSDQICDEKELVSIDLDLQEVQTKTVAEEKLNLPKGQNIEHLVGENFETFSADYSSLLNLSSTNRYQKDSTWIESSLYLLCSLKDGRVWEPGGLPTKMHHWDWFEKELKPYGESHKVATFLYSQMQVVRSNLTEFKNFDRKKSNETLSLDDERDVEHEQNQVIKLISSWTNRIWEPGGITLLSQMVCAFLLPILTMNMDSRTICLTSRSIFVDDAANIALRRIVEDRFVLRMEEIYIESIKQNLEFATDRGWIEFWINAHVFTLTNSGSKLSSSEYTKHILILVYHLCSLSSSRLFVKTYTGCIVALLMVYDAERLIQLDAPPIFSDLLCVMNRIRVRLKMVLLVEFLWLILFASKMFKSSNVHQNKNQVDQKLSSYWKLLLRLLHPLHINRWRSFYLLVIKSLFKGKEESVSFNVAVPSCSSYVKVLELIKDKASKKRKLCKNWWFKYKHNTWLSEALHFWRKKKSEKLQRASKHMICELLQKKRRNVEDGVKQDNNRFKGDVKAKIIMALGELHLLQDVFEMVKELLLKTSFVVQQVRRNKKIRPSKRWWFKYKYHCYSFCQESFANRITSFSTNLEVKVSLKGEDLIQDERREKSGTCGT